MSVSRFVILSAIGMLAAAQAFAENSVVAKDDAQVAAEYREEAAVLAEKAAHHRQLSERYRARGPGKVDGAQIARHCESLAANYEKAAKDASAIAEALSK